MKTVITSCRCPRVDIDSNCKPLVTLMPHLALQKKLLAHERRKRTLVPSLAHMLTLQWFWNSSVFNPKLPKGQKLDPRIFGDAIWSTIQSMAKECRLSEDDHMKDSLMEFQLIIVVEDSYTQKF